MAVVQDQVTLCWESFVGCWASECKDVGSFEMGMRHWSIRTLASSESLLGGFMVLEPWSGSWFSDCEHTGQIQCWTTVVVATDGAVVGAWFRIPVEWLLWWGVEVTGGHKRSTWMYHRVELRLTSTSGSWWGHTSWHGHAWYHPS